jgi:Uma2 family endonuclease
MTSSQDGRRTDCYTGAMSGPTSARRRATYDDLLAVPDHLVAELIDGELYTSPRPAVPHAIATGGLSSDLINPFDRGRGGPGGWWILVEPELHLAEDVIVPDVAAWRRSRVPELPRGAFLEIAPDWVCETLSPSSERIDRGKKQAIYAREGVAHLWMLNPITETLEAYRLEHGRWSLLGTHAGDVEARVEPFEAVELELWRLWGKSAPGSSTNV